MPWNIPISTQHLYQHDQRTCQPWKTLTSLIDKSKRRTEDHRQPLLGVKSESVLKTNMASRTDHGRTTGILDEEGDLHTLMGKDVGLHHMGRTESTPTTEGRVRLAIMMAMTMAIDNHEIMTIYLTIEKEDPRHNTMTILTLDGLLYLTHHFLHDHQFLK
jgi:hypothetical protein